MLKFKTEDYEFFYPLLESGQQKALSSCSEKAGDQMVVDDEDIEVDLYDWLGDAIVAHGLTDDQQAVSNVGARLESIMDEVYAIIEE